MRRPRAPTAPNDTVKLDGFPSPPDNDARYLALQNFLSQDQHIALVRGASRAMMNGFDAADTLRQVSDPVAPPFPLNPRTSLGNQLEQVAKLIGLRESLGMNRQIFFCSLGGFDTHFNQVNSTSPAMGTQANLFAQIDGALKAFYDATIALGVASQVVTFTLSDFSRTFVPNGNFGTMSVDQYGATLVSWFGVSTSDLSVVFPNGRFNQPRLSFL